jgi:prevent-host-death family protein
MVGLTEVRQRLTEILQQVDEGEHVVVTRNGHAVAQIVPLDAEPEGPRALGLAAIAGVASRRAGLAELVADVVALRSVARERDPGIG